MKKLTLCSVIFIIILVICLPTGLVVSQNKKISSGAHSNNKTQGDPVTSGGGVEPNTTTPTGNPEPSDGKNKTTPIPVDPEPP